MSNSILKQGVSTLAARRNRLGSFKKYQCLDPSPRDADVNWFRIQPRNKNFQKLLGDSHAQPRLRTTAVKYALRCIMLPGKR